jgi:5-methylcytosine-specific restriction endonuclease McrA
VKRGGPLARRTPLAPERAPVTLNCANCGVEFVYRPRGGLLVKACSPQCASALKRKGNGDRTGAANPNLRHRRRSGVQNRQGERRWYAGRHKRCALCGGPGGELGIVLHHVVYRQHVRVERGDEWDPRNAMPLCNSCHMSHHRRGRVIPLSKLPDLAYEFAGELLGRAAYDYLARRYLGDDSRLVALLDLPARVSGPTAGGSGHVQEVQQHGG